MTRGEDVSVRLSSGNERAQMIKERFDLEKMTYHLREYNKKMVENTVWMIIKS